MRFSNRPFLAAMLIASSVSSLPAFAQGIGGSTGSSTTGGVGTGSSTGSFDTGSGGSLGGSTSGQSSSVLSEPISPGASSGGATGIGSGSSTSQSSPSDQTTIRATEGSSSIGEVNAGAFARSGNAGTSNVTSLGGEEGGMGSSSSSDYSYTAGAGSNSDYRIPSPPVGIDLGSIRSGLRTAPSATPKANGD